MHHFLVQYRTIGCFQGQLATSERLPLPITVLCFCFCRTALQEPVVHGDAGPPGAGATGLVEGILFRQASSGRSASKALTKPMDRRPSVYHPGLRLRPLEIHRALKNLTPILYCVSKQKKETGFLPKKTLLLTAATQSTMSIFLLHVSTFCIHVM